MGNQRQNISNVSFQAKAMYLSLKSFRRFSKKIFTKILFNPARGTNEISAKKLNAELSIKEFDIEGFSAITVFNDASTNNHILFFHGGGYTVEALKGHRTLVEKLVQQYHFKVTSIDYPLAPENTADKTIDVAEKAYSFLCSEYRSDSIYLLGDSAGGGLALALLQILRDKQEENMPQKTVLLSPWLDITLSHPEIADFEHKELILDVDALRKCGLQYAGSLEPKDPGVSPIYGNHSGLGAIHIWVSDHEILCPDCVLLHKKLTAAEGSSSTLTVKHKLVHDWIVMPLPERDVTILEVATAIH